MILLYGAIATILTEIIKFITKKIGLKLARAYILGIVFVLCLVWALVDHWAKIAVPGFWEMFLGSAASGIAIYEIFVKTIWKEMIIKKA